MKIGEYKHSKEIKKRLSELHKGKKLSEETKRKISERLKGRKKPFRSLEHRRKISESNKGKKISEEAKQKISRNNCRFWLGKHHSENTKNKLRQYTGEKNSRWLGGISFEPYSIDWTETLRRSIRERDHYICQKCSQYGNVVHHIDYNKKNCNPDNLITLCISCNSKVNTNREFWLNYFK